MKIVYTHKPHTNFSKSNFLIDKIDNIYNFVQYNKFLVVYYNTQLQRSHAEVSSKFGI